MNIPVICATIFGGFYGAYYMINKQNKEVKEIYHNLLKLCINKNE